MKVDPRTDAVRGDLADIRLADRIFAPHYAAPRPMAVARDVILRAEPATESETLATLAAGDTFEVLDFSGKTAWGTASASGLVGYVDASALAQP